MIRFTWLLLVLCLAWSSHAQQREQRVALVIGNGAYQSSPLKNPVNDATDMAQALKDKGFAVTLRTNIGNRDMRQAIRAFSQTLKAGGVGLFYFAGHGVQSKGRNYLIPLNAEIKEEFELKDEAFDANRVLAGMEEAGNRVNIVILDACRDNPFGRAWRTSATGLAQLSAPIGSFVAFATAPGSVAADGSGRNGLFTSHLLTSLRNPDSDIDRVFTRVAAAVARRSGNKQVPWKSSSLTGEFCFGDCARANQPPVVVAQASNTSDDRFWDSVKDTKDANELKAYLNKFPGGLFAELAGIRLRSLEQAAADRIAAEAAQRAALERAAAEAAAKEQQRLAMEAQAKEQARLALLAQEQARVAAEAAQKLAAARLAELPKPGQAIKDCADCPEMVVIPAGSFEMGSNENADERPVHRVNVPSFLIGTTEVTQGQWKAVMGRNSSRFSQCGDDCPVDRVSWNEAQEFAQRLSQKTGKQYRLPSEAEWEYAAKAGSNTKWSFNDNESQSGEYAWFVSNSQNRTQRVAQKRPNAFGLFDMHGNVWEWTQDCFNANYSGAPTSGNAWESGDCSKRVLRGGSWDLIPTYLRSAFRNLNSPDFRNFNLGFRLARTLLTATLPLAPITPPTPPGPPPPNPAPTPPLAPLAQPAITSPSGGSGNTQQAAGPSASYAGRVRAKLKPNLVLFEETRAQISGNPVAEVEVRASANGSITERKLIKSSGARAWDDAVLRAIDKMESLPRDTDGRVPPLLVIVSSMRD